MLWYLDLGRKHLHAQQTSLLSLLLRNKDVVSQDHLGIFKVFFSFFFTKLCGFLRTFAITFSPFLDRVAKHRIICFTDISSSSNTLKIRSKILHVIFVGSFSNSTWWFLVLSAASLVVLIIMRHFKNGFSQSHLFLFAVKLKLKLQIWSWKNLCITYCFKSWR